MARHAFLLFALGAASLAAPVAGQRRDDARDRDRVVRNDGRELFGRVEAPFATDEVLLLQGGKRVRLARGEVATMDLVGNRVREFCERRQRLAASPKAQSYLMDWAAAHELPGLARLQALWLVLADDDQTAAHELLGHRRAAKGWTWPLEGRQLTREQFEDALAKQPLELTGERFTTTCTGNLRATVAALLDLEQLGVVWFARFGEPLQLREVLTPIRIELHRNRDEFPKWGFRPLPYYVPPPHGDVARTFYAGANPDRAERLFFVATEALLYRTLIGEADRQNDRDRVCAWLEIGLGMVMENTMQGEPGAAAPAPPRAADLQALQALSREARLGSLLHLAMYSGFYLMDDTPTAANWATATMLVAYLLDEDEKPSLREPFFAYVRQALVGRKGDSSSAFDQAFGRRAEALEEPFRVWLAKQAQ